MVTEKITNHFKEMREAFPPKLVMQAVTMGIAILVIVHLTNKYL